MALNEEEFDNSNEPSEEKSPRQWAVILVLCSGNFLVGCCMSLQGPFFPKEAEDKNISPKVYGLIFGAYYLSAFVFSHVCGKCVSDLKPKFLFSSGLFTTGVCYILFGILHRCPGGATYEILAFSVRFIEGMGSAACKTSVSTFVLSEFRNEVPKTFANIEMAFGTGLFLGPVVGGILYESKGYMSPFLAFGITLVICTLTSIYFLPNLESKKSSKASRVVKFWLHPGLLIEFLVIVCATMCVGYNETGLEPHLRQFDLSPVGVGLVFVISGGTYALFAPLWGVLGGGTCSTKVMTTAGCILICFSFLFIGPVPFIPVDTKLWTIAFSLGVLGIGQSATLISTFLDIIKETKRRGFPDDLVTYGLASSFFSSAVALGYFAGPSIGGFLIENVGYRSGTIVFIIIQSVLICCLCLYILWEKNSNGVVEDEEKILLLESAG